MLSKHCFFPVLFISIYMKSDILYMDKIVCSNKSNKFDKNVFIEVLVNSWIWLVRRCRFIFYNSSSTADANNRDAALLQPDWLADVPNKKECPCRHTTVVSPCVSCLVCLYLALSFFPLSWSSLRCSSWLHHLASSLCPLSRWPPASCLRLGVVTRWLGEGMGSERHRWGLFRGTGWFERLDCWIYSVVWWGKSAETIHLSSVNKNRGSRFEGVGVRREGVLLEEENGGKKCICF